MLGKDLMPWQRRVLDVALEVDPETDRLVYREVVLTVPRQSGKTTEVLCVTVHRSLGFSRPQRITYTAQTRLAAREKWQYEHIPMLTKSPLGGMFRPVFQRGEERIVWDNGSIYGIESTQESAGHGNTLDLGIIDEAFARVDAAGEQAMRPAMITRPDAQLWVLSTAGKSKAKSPYLWGKVKAGRARLDAGMPSATAYFEWSAPVDMDPYDPATWWACMPALGHIRADGTGVSEAAIRAELESMDLADFRRAYLNQWLDDVVDGWEVVPRESWLMRAGAAGPPDAPVAFAVAVAWPAGDFSAIAVAGRRDGELVTQVVDHRPGTSWVAGRVQELRDRHSPCAIVLDPSNISAAADVKAELDRLEVELVTPSMVEVAQAAGLFWAAVCGDAPSLRHFGQPDLDAALAAAQQRTVGDKWTWARKGAVDISPLEAVTLAAWGHATRGHLIAAEPWGFFA